MLDIVSGPHKMLLPFVWAPDFTVWYYIQVDKIYFLKNGVNVGVVNVRVYEEYKHNSRDSSCIIPT